MNINKEIEKYKKLINLICVDYNDHEEIKKYLTKDNVNGIGKFEGYYDNSFPVMLAIENDDSKLLNLVIKKGANINKLYPSIDFVTDVTPLMLSIDNEAYLHYQDFYKELPFTMSQMLLDNGVDIKIKTANDETALDIAISVNHYTAVDILKKIDTLMKRFMNAIYTGDIDEIMSCLNEEANVNMKYDGSFPLFCALANEQFEVFDILIDNGAKINKYNGLLKSAIGADVTNYEYQIHELGNTEIKEPDDKYVKFLIDRDIDVNLKDEDDDESPLDYAKKIGHTKAVSLLQIRGAE